MSVLCWIITRTVVAFVVLIEVVHRTLKRMYDQRSCQPRNEEEPTLLLLAAERKYSPAKNVEERLKK